MLHLLPHNRQQDSITIIQEEEEDEEVIDRNSKKAPNSFLLYKTIRRQDANGKYLSSHQLMDEWNHMSKEQKAEFQNQSQCIQFTLDIDNRTPNNTTGTGTTTSTAAAKKMQQQQHMLPKIVVPPPSSMVIPNDHSVDHLPSYKSTLYHHHHPLSDLLLGPPSSSSATNHLSYYHHPHHHHPSTTTATTTTSTILSHTTKQANNNNYSMPYSAAAEAAALQSLSFNPPPPPPTTTQAQAAVKVSMDTHSSSIKKKYGILPEKVKRPPNAYLLFNRDMRRQLHDVNRGLSSGEISKSISARWKQLSSAERDYYIKEEAKLKQQHNNEHANFIYTRRSKAEMKEAGSLKQQQKPLKLATSTSTTTGTKRKVIHSSQQQQQGRDPRGRKKKKQDDTLPKHPMSGYLHFAKEMRPVMKKRYPDARLVEISKHIGAQWRSMSEAELQPWIDIANRDKERYAQQMKDRINNQQQQQRYLREDDDSSSSSASSASSHHTSNLILDYDKTVEDLDINTIATVAQMVNRRSY